MTTKILVWDPIGEFVEGDLFDGEQRIAAIERRGGVFLPYEREIGSQNNAVAGYYRRTWGSGVVFDRMIGRKACPMVLYVTQGASFIHWAARVMPIDHSDVVRGLFRCVSDTGQIGTLGGGMNAVDNAIEISELPIDKFGGWTIRGTNRLNCSLTGYLGVAIHARAFGARVVWSAITQASV